MKNLVLGSLLLAGLVSQTTGCIITSGGEDATINAEWSFHAVDARGTLSPLPCPAGFSTVALHNQQVDASLRPIDAEIVDLFDCIDQRNFSDPLPPGTYETFLAVTSDGGAALYANSLSAIVDVTTSDKTFSAQLVDNGGYFKVAWDLREDGSNAPLECRDVIGIDGIEIASTLAGTTAAVTDIFDCEVGFDFSAAVMEGTYDISMDVLDTAGAAIGQGKALLGEVMRDRNQVTDLGTVTLLVP